MVSVVFMRALVPLLNLLAGLRQRVELRQQAFTASHAEGPFEFPGGVFA
jgi:hypothetical protein